MLPVLVVPVAALVAVTARALTAACGLGDFGGDCGDDEYVKENLAASARTPRPRNCWSSTRQGGRHAARRRWGGGNPPGRPQAPRPRSHRAAL
ncbi:hypothetical protein PF003_g33192 [Phytophthora fragariae]|nr:hypothetical protein PF003_g33192 [Phytophthora fragariae]